MKNIIVSACAISALFVLLSSCIKDIPVQDIYGTFYSTQGCLEFSRIVLKPNGDGQLMYGGKLENCTYNYYNGRLNLCNGSVGCVSNSGTTITFYGDTYDVNNIDFSDQDNDGYDDDDSSVSATKSYTETFVFEK
jgi:hypothetical protein